MLLLLLSSSNRRRKGRSVHKEWVAVDVARICKIGRVFLVVGNFRWEVDV